MEIGSILVVSAIESDHAFIHGLFNSEKWQVRAADSWRHASDHLSRDRVGVVLCEKELPDGAWKDVLASLSAMPDAPALIVASEHADDKLWAEVLNLGGYDVLMKPFDRTEVGRVVSLAWQNWASARGESGRAASAGI
jgi:DNA-binding NtrC family response regulator